MRYLTFIVLFACLLHADAPSEEITFTDNEGENPAQEAVEAPKEPELPESVKEYAELIKRSPFLPSDYIVLEPDLAAEEEAPPEAQDLELRGLLRMGDTFKASLYNKTSTDSFWITMGDPQASYKIREFDLEKRSIILDDGFSKKTLTLIDPQPPAPTSNVTWPETSMPQKPRQRRPPSPEEIEEERQTAELLRRLLSE